jgi:hypothetical protein
LVVALERLDLSGRERLSALAGIIAAAAVRRHIGGTEQLFSRLFELTRPGIGTDAGGVEGTGERPDRNRIGEAQAALETGLARLASALEAERVGSRQAAFVETVLLARLLGAYRPAAIRRALAAASQAVADRSYRAGDLIIVPASEVPVRTAA